MTLYYYNHSQGHERIATFFNGISDSKCITNEDCRRRPQFNEGDVVFVHPGDDETTGYGKQWWVDLARNNITVDFVFMSTQPTEIGPGGSDSADIHYCKYAAHTLSEQPRVKEFFTLLIAKGGKHWDLLIPPPFPEYLVAAYLVQTAAIKGVSVNPESGCTGFWKKAREEFDQRAAQEGEISEFTPNGDPSKLKSLLESIARGS